MEEPSAVYSRARYLVNCIEFQLQQLEEQDAGSRHAGAAGSLSGAPPSSLADDDSMRRHAITENLNRLSAEVALLERSVAETYGGVAAAAAKSDLWRKLVTVVVCAPAQLSPPSGLRFPRLLLDG